MKLLKLLILALVTASALTYCSKGCTKCEWDGCYMCHEREMKATMNWYYKFYECEARHSLDENCLFYSRDNDGCFVCKKGYTRGVFGKCLKVEDADPKCARFGKIHNQETGQYLISCESCEYSVRDPNAIDRCIDAEIPSNCMEAFSKDECRLCKPGYALFKTNEETKCIISPVEGCL